MSRIPLPLVTAMAILSLGRVHVTRGSTLRPFLGHVDAGTIVGKVGGIVAEWMWSTSRIHDAVDVVLAAKLGCEDIRVPLDVDPGEYGWRPTSGPSL